MGLKEEMSKTLGVKDVKRIQYWDSRYYKVLYELKEKGKKPRLVQEHMASVTEILGILPPPFLSKWRGDIGNERADQIIREAWQLGSFIHFAAEILAKGGKVIFNPVEHPNFTEDEVEKLKKKHGDLFCICRYQIQYVQIFRIWQFLNLVKPTKVETEQTVYSIEHKYAGTLDGIGYIKGGKYAIAGSVPVELEEGWWVWDYKTGKGTSATNKRQLAAYIQAVLEGKPDLKLKGGLLIHPNNEKITTGIVGLKVTSVTMKEQPTLLKQFLSIYDVYRIEHPIPTPTEFAMPLELTYGGK